MIPAICTGARVFQNRPASFYSLSPGVSSWRWRMPEPAAAWEAVLILRTMTCPLKILEKKLQSLENSGAEILVTGCMGCMLQFMDGVYQKEKNTRVMHLVEMLDQYLP